MTKSKQPKPTKTQAKIQRQYDEHHSYKRMVSSTGIDSKRLGQIRAGKGEKPSRSEISRIAYYKVQTPSKRPGQQVTIDDIKKSTGFSKDAIRAALKSGSSRVTRKTVDDDNTYLLKTADNANFRLMMVVHINVQTGDSQIGLSKRYDFKILGATGTRYEEFRGLSGNLYAFTITVFRLHQYTNLKPKVERAVKKIVSVPKGDTIEQTDGIQELLDLLGYD